MIATAHSPARLMLYAVISAIETDLGAFLSRNAASYDARTFLGSSLYASALERAHSEDAVVSSDPELAELLPFVDFSDRFKLVNKNRDLLPPHVAGHVRDVTPKLERVAPVRNRVMHSRPLKGGDIPEVFEVAEQLAGARVELWNELRDVLERLRSDPTFVHSLRIPVTAETPPDSATHNLPTPDFDETGFVGREEYLEKVKGALKGPYPVVTILGEGGAGKTAAAVKVAYDILEESPNRFDAIVWASSKTQLLTATEVRGIENSISNSLGLLSSVAQTLGGQGITDPIPEVIEYLSQFRILLILDNLETVLDDRIRNFLGGLPQNSKVLVTSRIGLGAYEHPIKLAPMTNDEAVILLRSLARSRGLADLVRASNKQVSTYTDRLNRNPGFIKWFVAGVQAGQSPEALLAQPDTFLDFCLSNVYGYLQDPARRIVRSLMVVPEECGRAEIGYYSGLDGLDLTSGLNQLLTTNMLTPRYTPIGSSFDTTYVVNDLARKYLERNHPLSGEEVREIVDRRKELVATQESMQAAAEKNAFFVTTIALRSKGDVIAARQLRDALRQAKEGDYGGARDLVDRARALAPDYYEVHRVTGVVNAWSGDVLGAREAYLRALDISPDSAPLHYSYGMFLLEYLDDLQGAEREAREAHRLAPDAIRVRVLLARTVLYQHRWDEARGMVEALSWHDISLTDARTLADLRVQSHSREADFWAHQGDYERALSAFEGMRDAVTNTPAEFRDRAMIDRARKAQLCVRWLGAWADRDSTDDSLRRRVISFEDWYARFCGFSQAELHSEGETVTGVVSALPLRETYGFIQLRDGESVFFHRSSLVDQGAWERLSVGTNVTAVLTTEGGDLKASSVVVESGGRVDLPPVGTSLSGIVHKLVREKGFGFVRAEHGPVFFFHRSMVATARDWTEASEGASVIFEVGRNPVDGRICARNIRLKQETGQRDA